MRNRAKCKLCLSIIESFHEHDYVGCKCGEIAIDGGDKYLRASAKDFRNFLRVDDHGDEIIVKVVNDDAQGEEKSSQNADENPCKPNRKELLDELKVMIENIEKLPTHALSLPITHYDFVSALMLLSAIFRSEEEST